MTEEQKAAYIFSQSVAALIELESMCTANAERESRGEQQIYSEDAILSLQNKYGVHHNAVCSLFQGT